MNIETGNIIDAEYISFWDDGATEVHSEVKVDMDEMEIVEWGKRWYEGHDVPDDSFLENLDGEIVVVDDDEYTAMNADTYAQHEADGDIDDYDEYGRGIIAYD